MLTICSVCGALYNARRKRAPNYCSGACRVRSHRKRRANGGWSLPAGVGLAKAEPETEAVTKMSADPLDLLARIQSAQEQAEADREAITAADVAASYDAEQAAKLLDRAGRLLADANELAIEASISRPAAVESRL